MAYRSGRGCGVMPQVGCDPPLDTSWNVRWRWSPASPSCTAVERSGNPPRDYSLSSRGEGVSFLVAVPQIEELRLTGIPIRVPGTQNSIRPVRHQWCRTGLQHSAIRAIVPGTIGIRAEWGSSHLVSAGRGIAAPSGPVCVEELAARPIRSFVGVGAEIVTLCLDQIGRQSPAPVAVVEGKCR